MFIDTHAHLNFREYKDEISKVITNAQEAQVGVIVNVGSNYQTSQKTIKIAEKYNNLYSAIGIHPIHLVKDITESATFDGRTYSFTTRQEDFNYQEFKNLARSSKKVVAIGETGIDIFRLEDDKHSIPEIFKLQSNVLRQHIKLAKELNLPLILHTRGAEKDSSDAYNIMLKVVNKARYFRGVIHSFVGNPNQAKKFIDLGFYLGVNGIVTFKNGKNVQEIIRKVSLEKILIETDCPFLAPVPYRGKRNEPAYVVEVAKKIAELKNIPLAEVEKTTTQNAINLFKLEI